MKRNFDEIEYGMELLKKEGEKTGEINCVDRFLKYIEKECIKSFYFFRIKYALLCGIIILFGLNIFVILSFLNKSNQKIVPVSQLKIPPLSETILTKKENPKVEKRSDKLEERIVTVNIELPTEKCIPLEETLKFTEEINKIIKLFIFDFKIGEENEKI